MLRGHPFLGLAAAARGPARRPAARRCGAWRRLRTDACRRGRIDRRRRGDISGPAACCPRGTQSRRGAAGQSDRTMRIRSRAMRRAPARATDRNRRELALPGGHGQRAARSQVERLDPNDLDARQQRTPKHRLLFRQQPPRRFGVAAIERRSAHGPAARCSAGGESPSATIARCSRPFRALLRQDRPPPATRSCSACTTRWRGTGFRGCARRPAAPEPAATPRRALPGTSAPRSRGSARCSIPT